MAKRILKEKILDELTSDELWDKALDEQEIARSYYNVATCRYHYKIALKYANAAQRSYLEDAKDIPEDRQTFLDYADLTRTKLIVPFQEKIVQLDRKLADIQDRKTKKIQTDTKSTNASSTIVTSSTSTVPGTTFSLINPANISIYNLFTIRGYKNIQEISCLTGTNFEKFDQLINRLSNVLTRKLARDILNPETMQQYAEDLIKFSYECKDKLVSWLQPHLTDSSFQDLQKSVLELARKSAKAAEIYYKQLSNKKLASEAKQLVADTTQMLAATNEETTPTQGSTSKR